jgi:hypothetical protein
MHIQVNIHEEFCMDMERPRSPSFGIARRIFKLFAVLKFTQRQNAGDLLEIFTVFKARQGLHGCVGLLFYEL